MSGLTDAGNFDAYALPVVTTWTSGTAQGTAVTVTTAGLDTVALTINCSAGISGGVITFNAFDGLAYIPIKCPLISNYATASQVTLSSNLLQGFTVPIAGYPAFQVVLTTGISGVGNVFITTVSSSAPDVSVVAAGIDPTSTSPPVGSGSIVSGQATVGTSSTLIVAARTGVGGNGLGQTGTGRQSVTISNGGTATIFVGPTGVTTSNGLAIAQNTSVTLYTAAAVYGVVASATQPASYLETF
jgi:hypothetical protein